MDTIQGKIPCIDNCVATKSIHLMSEWHPTKNGSLTPYDFSLGSGKSVWWKCSRGHEWKAVICNRSKGVGCPICSKIILKDGSCFDSMAEAYFYLKLKGMKIGFLHDLRYGNGSKKKIRFLPNKNIHICGDDSI